MYVCKHTLVIYKESIKFIFFWQSFTILISPNCHLRAKLGDKEIQLPGARGNQPWDSGHCNRSPDAPRVEVGNICMHCVLLHRTPTQTPVRCGTSHIVPAFCNLPACLFSQSKAHITFCSVFKTQQMEFLR